MYIKETQRIHKKMKELKAQNIEKTEKIENGSLIVDDIIVDKNHFFCLGANYHDFDMRCKISCWKINGIKEFFYSTYVQELFNPYNIVVLRYLR